MKYKGKTGAYFEVVHVSSINDELIGHLETNELALLWFDTDDNQLEIDSVNYTFNTNDILCLTSFHKVKTINIHTVKLLKWNKPFYCIINHDSEVGCKGVLFYGAYALPVIHPNQQDVKTFDTVWKMLEQEMVSQDALQEEMLQMMLKRTLILCMRMFKEQTDYKKVDHLNIDIIREYNFLVEQHYKEKHTVAEYAELLHKSPKTLSNLFKKIGSKTPLKFIQDRKTLEARRLLSYTDKAVSEIGYELGFADVQSFSRFFKKQEGKAPADYRNSY